MFGCRCAWPGCRHRCWRDRWCLCHLDPALLPVLRETAAYRRACAVCGGMSWTETASHGVGLHSGDCSRTYAAAVAANPPTGAYRRRLVRPGD